MTAVRRNDASSVNLRAGTAIAPWQVVVAVAVNDETSTVRLDGATRSETPRSRRASAPLVTGERYEVGELIGRGGMGEVCSAYDAQIGREVAIKRMQAEQPTAAQVARFMREARIQGRLEHPAIPPVHELASDSEGRLFFVMKKLTGVTLSEILRAPDAHRRFTRQRLLHAFVDVCHAIELAHANGIVHRDLKPANLLLGERGEVYVLDWGIARELDAPDAYASLAVGTPGYMSPEQTRGDEDLDGRADVYALGCLLHAILTGSPRHPRLATPVRPPTVEVPPELELLCAAATLDDRAKRLASVDLLSEAVQRYLDGDRDVEQRRVLAARHFAAAQTALATPGDEVTRRRVAMREAGRALALDPSLDGVAELVGGLMIAPPIATPEAVGDELAALDRATDRQHLRAVIKLNVLTTLLLPALLLVFGIRDVTYLVAYGTIGMLTVAGQIGAMKSERFMRLGAPLGALMSIAGLAVVARMFTPLLFAPGFAAVSLMSFGLSSLARARKVIAMCALTSIATILAVWAAEPLGWLSQTVWIDGGSIVLRVPLEGVEHFPIVLGLCCYVVVLTASAASIANAVSSMQYKAREHLQIQSWHLRQLL